MWYINKTLKIMILHYIGKAQSLKNKKKLGTIIAAPDENLQISWWKSHKIGAGRLKLVYHTGKCLYFVFTCTYTFSCFLKPQDIFSLNWSRAVAAAGKTHSVWRQTSVWNVSLHWKKTSHHRTVLNNNHILKDIFHSAWQQGHSWLMCLQLYMRNRTNIRPSR